MSKIGILGTGTWGTALAKLLSENGHEVTAWAATGGNKLNILREEHRHPQLPGAVLPESIRFTDDLEETCRGKQFLIFAVGSVYIRSTTAKARPYITRDQILVDASKGLETETFYTMTEVIREEAEKDERLKGIPVAVLSGPTHAEEVALGLPSSIVAACRDEEAARRIQTEFASDSMRVYTNTDPRGVGICGALKNIMALAAGISVGLGYGDNARAALITRGMWEICRIGLAEGCNERTFFGLAGVGDLIVTATSMHSRNNRTGVRIGQGVKAEDAVKEIGMVVEGINALPAALALGKKHGLETPLITAVNEIINHGADPRETVLQLMNREGKSEA